MNSLANKRIAVYARFSSVMQNEASIDDQVYRCRKYIEEHGGSFDKDLIFSDRAVSGASLQRAGFESLLHKARNKEIDIIVVEDMSRVSRDMADAASLYRELRFLSIRMIGVGDGIDTANKGSKLTFNIKAIMADLFLEDLGDKTTRGLDGRARAGFSTGGLPFGYKGVPELDDRGESRGSRVVVDEQQAAVIQRIFQMYADGHSFADIAGALNDEGVEPPRFKTRHRKKGWVKSTVRGMLENPAYTGAWSYKRKQWSKVPGTNTRRYKKRPEEEVFHQHYEDRRIVDEKLWSEVQQRRATVSAKYTQGRGHGAPGKRTKYPLSGLLKCGVCGAPMVINTGSSAAYYACGDRKNRRTCSNKKNVREDSTREQIFSALERQFSSSEAIAYLRKSIAEHLRALGASANAELRERQGRLERTRERLAYLVDFIAQGNVSPTIASTIRDLEAQAQQEEHSISALKARARGPVVLPTPDAVLKQGLRLGDILRGDPLRARELLLRLFRNEGVTMTPQPDGSYLGEGVFFPLIAFDESNSALGLTTKLQRPGTSAPGRSTAVSCAGRI
jgi:site-specific DNA recombinase